MMDNNLTRQTYGFFPPNKLDENTQVRVDSANVVIKKWPEFFELFESIDFRSNEVPDNNWRKKLHDSFSNRMQGIFNKK